MNNIEEQLWNYIDGTTSPEERRAITTLIEQDETYRKKYDELLLLNAEFSAIEFDEPPMAFTYNVMETIRNENAQAPLKSRLNPFITKGLGLFFVLTISTILIYALTRVHWSAGTAVNIIHFNLPNLSKHLSSPIMQGFLFFDVVLALYTFDTYLRRKNLTKMYTSVQSGRQQK